MIEFRCGTCGLNLKVENRHAGKASKCPRCVAKVIVPNLSPNLDEIIPFDQVYAVPPRRASGRLECPFCHTDAMPLVRSQISTAGWIVFVVLLLLCFPLCLIALFIKEDFRVCSRCGIKLG